MLRHISRQRTRRLYLATFTSASIILATMAPNGAAASTASASPAVMQMPTSQHVSPNVLFRDNFTYPGNLDAALSTLDNNWLYQGAPLVWARTNSGTSLPLGGNDATRPISDSTIQVAPGLPAAYFNQNGAGSAGLYQVSGVSWASHPVAFSFQSDFEHGQGYTSTVLLTPDAYTSAAQLPVSPEAEKDYIGLFATPNGKMSVRQSVNGAMRELGAFAYDFRADEMRDWRVTLDATGAITVEEYIGMDGQMTDSSLGAESSMMPSMWMTLFSGSQSTGFTSGHLRAGLTVDRSFSGERGIGGGYGAYATFDNVSEIDPSALPIVSTPRITSVQGENSSVKVSFTTDQSDPNIVGYSVAWYSPDGWAMGTPTDRKNSTWVGQGVIECNGIAPSTSYTFTVQPILIGGLYGPASAPVSAQIVPFSAQQQVGASLNGFLDDWSGAEATNGFPDPTKWDARWYAITHDSPNFVMARHWMSNALLGDTSQALAPLGGLALRARTPFDFSSSSSGPFGVLYDEVDLHTYARSWLDIDVIPALYDMRQLPRFFQGIDPPQYLSLTHSQGQLTLRWVDGTGASRSATSATYAGVPDLRDHIAIKLSRNQFDLYLNTPITGTPFFEVPNLDLPFTSGYVYQVHAAYHTDIPAPYDTSPDRMEYHWSTIGFTAPPGTMNPSFQVVQPASCQTGFTPNYDCDGHTVAAPVNETLTLPLTATTAQAVRFLMVTNLNYGSQPTTVLPSRTQATLSVNGHAPISLYNTDGSDQSGIVAEIPITELQSGANTFTISQASGAFSYTDPQVELEWNGSSPAFVDQQVTYMPPPPSSLPSPWADTDLGTPASPGYATSDNSTTSLQVSGSGNSLNTTMGQAYGDQGHFAYQSLAGDGQIVAHLQSTGAGVVSSLSTPPTVNATAGIMMRSSTDAGASSAGLYIQSRAGNAAFIRRTTAGGSASATTLPGYNNDSWLKLVRQGNTVTSYVSYDGAYWTSVGTDSVPMSATIEAGLFESGADGVDRTTGTFDNVTVGAATPSLATPPNLLASPGFEQGFTPGWTSYGNVQVTDPSHGLVHSGSVSFRTNTGGGGAYQDVSGLQPDTTYIASAFLASEQVGNNALNQPVALTIQNYGGPDLTSAVVTGTTWTRVTVRFTTGGTSTLARFNITAQGRANFSGYADDTTLLVAPASVTVPAATSITTPAMTSTTTPAASPVQTTTTPPTTAPPTTAPTTTTTATAIATARAAATGTTTPVATATATSIASPTRTTTALPATAPPTTALPATATAPVLFTATTIPTANATATATVPSAPTATASPSQTTSAPPVTATAPSILTATATAPGIPPASATATAPSIPTALATASDTATPVVSSTPLVTAPPVNALPATATAPSIPTAPAPSPTQTTSAPPATATDPAAPGRPASLTTTVTPARTYTPTALPTARPSTKGKGRTPARVVPTLTSAVTLRPTPITTLPARKTVAQFKDSVSVAIDPTTSRMVQSRGRAYLRVHLSAGRLSTNELYDVLFTIRNAQRHQRWTIEGNAIPISAGRSMPARIAWQAPSVQTRMYYDVVVTTYPSLCSAHLRSPSSCIRPRTIPRIANLHSIPGVRWTLLVRPTRAGTPTKSVHHFILASPPST